jgi:hypothetical protein
MEHQAELEPEAVERLQRTGKGERGEEESGGDDQSPGARRPAPHQRSQAKEREENRKDDSEGSVRPQSRHLLDDEPLMSVRGEKLHRDTSPTSLPPSHLPIFSAPCGVLCS